MTVVPTVRLFVARSCELFGFGKVPELEGTMSIGRSEIHRKTGASFKF